MPDSVGSVLPRRRSTVARRGSVAEDRRRVGVRPIRARDRSRADRASAARLSVELLRLPRCRRPAGRPGLADPGLLGFGLSDKPRPHRYSLLEQADIVQDVVADAGVGPVVLLAHDMGTSVATELLARDISGGLPFDLQRAVLTNGSVIIERPACAAARRSCAVRSARCSPGSPTNAASSADSPNCSARSTAVRRGGRGPVGAAGPRGRPADFTCCARTSTAGPVSPPLARRACGTGPNRSASLGHRRSGRHHQRARRPAGTPATAADVIELPGIGHYPQIEVPDRFTAGATQLLGLT